MIASFDVQFSFFVVFWFMVVVELLQKQIASDSIMKTPVTDINVRHIMVVITLTPERWYLK